MKTILVTGGAGFVGSHLCERLVKEGHKVISLDNYFTGLKENHIDGVEYREGHTKDIAKHITEKPDMIFHLGEYSRVAIAMEEPEKVLDLNLVGTLGVVEFWRKHKCKLIYAGSSTKFSDKRPDGIEGPGLSPYTWTKAANSDLIRNYGNWYGLDFAITYFHNVYGPRELSGRYGTVIEIFKQQYLNNKPLTVRPPLSQERNYTHINDTINGLVLISEKGSGDGFAISSEKPYSLEQLTKLFDCEVKILEPSKADRMSTKINIDKLKDLGWAEKESLEDYINELKKQK